MKIEEEQYKGWKIYSAPFLSNKLIGEKIIDNNFDVINILKDTKRNYVAIVEIDNTKYVLKEFRSEIIIPQRRVMTFFKDGEALTTLKNGLEALEEGIIELVKPLIALVNRKGTIGKSYLLMEYIDGNKIQTKKDVEKIIKIIKKVHNLGRYHGDLNTSNFIRVDKDIKIIDTQMKKEKYFWLKRSRDFLILKEDSLVLELKISLNELYPEILEKREYLLARILRKIKKLKVIEYIRKKKKKLREKGWKI